MKLLGDLETGARDNFSEPTKSIVEHFLGWESGSLDRIANGGTPITLTDPRLTRIGNRWPRLSEEVRTLLVEIAERSDKGRRGR